MQGLVIACTPESSSRACIAVLSEKFSDRTVAPSQYDIRFCSETLVSDMRHMSEFLVPGLSNHVFVLLGQDSSTVRGLASY